MEQAPILTAETEARNRSAITVHRRDIRFHSDDTRVITRFFRAGMPPRMAGIVERIASCEPATVAATLEEVRALFLARHKDLGATLQRHFNRLCEILCAAGFEELVAKMERYDAPLKLLLGSYFTLEYAVQAAAFFNPSVVTHPDQSGLEPGQARIIISFRAVGEGHISSISFRSGVVGPDGDIQFDPISEYSETPEVVRDPSYDKYCFRIKLGELGCEPDFVDPVMDRLDDFFTRDQLNAAINEHRSTLDNQAHAALEHTLDTIDWLADSNYEIHFHDDHDLSERVIFPVSINETNGIEDARFVKFVDCEDRPCYYATYTAYNGVTILPQVIETHDFLHFRIITLNGDAVKGKGFALFPRKINGEYVMIGRQDGESLTYMKSDNIHFWQNAQPLEVPHEPWELIQVGNCGSPIETEKGWILFTHGVGPMRRYCIGAMLLDLDDPSKVIGRLREPLIEPNADEREGYVPNVLYSCGAMLHNGLIILPYAMSDSASAIATLKADDLVEELLRQGP